MKMEKAAAMLAAVVLLYAAGCSKSTQEAAAKQEAATALNGVVIYNGSGLSVKGDDGKMTVKLSLDAGETVTVFTETRDGTQAPITENAVRSYDNEKRDFTKIAYDGKEYWIQSIFLGLDGIPGIVVKNDVLVSKTGKLGDWTSQKIPQYTVLSVNTNQSKDGFYCVTAYTDQLLRDVFIKDDTVTISGDDVTALKLFRGAMAKKDPLVKKSVLQDALSLNSSFNDMIQIELDVMEGNIASHFVDSMSGTTFSADGGKINVRSMPVLDAANVVTQLESGAEVYISDQSDEMYDVGGAKNYWYKLSEPVNGWIFGEYVKLD